MKKRLLSGFIAFIMLLLTSVNGYSDYDMQIFADDNLFEEVKCGDNAYWTLDTTNNELFIWGSGAVDNYTFPKNIDSVVIDEGISEIGANAFRNSTLSAVAFPESLVKISDSAFWGCEYLTSLELPASIQSIGAAAFEKCPALKSIAIDEENTAFSVVDEVLYNKELTELILYPASKENVKFTIPDTVTSVAFCAFDYNKYIKELHIPKSVVSLGDGIPFYKIEAIENFVVAEDNPVYCDVYGNLYNKETTTFIKYAIGKSDTFFETQSTVATIAESAFESAHNLNSVRFSESVATIEYGALANCKGLSSITINNPNCLIASSILAGTFENDGLTIYGYSNSTAMNYATNNAINFELLEEKEIAAIEIKALPKKLVYEVGESLNTVGLIIKIIYIDNTFTERSMGVEVSTLDSNTVGTKEISVSYEGNTTTFSVEVVEKLEDITVSDGDKIAIDIIEPNQIVYVYFTPAESGTYNYYAESTSDTVGYIYDSGGNLLEENDDGSIDENDFCISYDFVEGVTYTLACKLLNENELGSFNIVVKKKVTEESTTQVPETTIKEPATTGNPTEVETTFEVVTTEKISTTEIKTTEKLPSTNSGTGKVSKPAKVKIRSVKKTKKKKVKVTWKKIKKVSGYQIRYSTNRKFKKKVKMIKKIKSSLTSRTIKGIKAKKTYYFQVRAYKKVNGLKVFGKWSKTKKIKVKKW